MNVRPRSFAAQRAVLLLLVPLALSLGCQPDDINRQYGQRRAAVGADSVNGTAVFAKMYEQAGHKVTTWRRLSPKLHQYDTLVWFPDTLDVPSPRERQFLDQWLARDSSKVLVYVGRDFDAGPLYWKKMETNAPPGQAGEIASRLSDALSDHNAARNRASQDAYARWFVRRNGKGEQVQSLRGPWAEGIDASKAEISVDWRLDPVQTDDLPKLGTTSTITPAANSQKKRSKRAQKYLTTTEYYYESPSVPQSETLLESGEGTPLVRRVTEPSVNEWSQGGKVIVVVNGSFLLNLPLVNHEHRKLAAKVIAESSPGGRVAFLESDAAGLDTYAQEPDAEIPSGLELFLIFPINAVILHLVAVGILFCFTVLPIFGRPRQLPREPTSDFGAHIGAVGELLQFAHDRQAARRALDEYHKVVRGAGARTTATTTAAAPATAAPAPNPNANLPSQP
ncbi:MAG: DUF4350 domain-containing protein [Pirellulales bacterium]